MSESKPNIVLLMDELLESWDDMSRAKGDTPAVCQRRIKARAAVEQAFAELERERNTALAHADATPSLWILDEGPETGAISRNGDQAEEWKQLGRPITTYAQVRLS